MLRAARAADHTQIEELFLVIQRRLPRPNSERTSPFFNSQRTSAVEADSYRLLDANYERLRTDAENKF